MWLSPGHVNELTIIEHIFELLFLIDSVKWQILSTLTSPYIRLIIYIKSDIIWQHKIIST